MTSQPILQVEGLSKHFGGVRAVEEVTFHVSPGEITSIIGPNGAGKTTVFNLITGIYEQTAGSIRFESVNLSEPVFDPFHAAVVSAASIGLGLIALGIPAARRRLYYRPRTPDSVTRQGIARTFQNIRLFSDLSVLDNVKVGFHARTRCRVPDAIFRSKRQRREEGDITAASLQYLDFVGLRLRANEEARGLAYGERRRLEIARALATHPRLLLLDEPAAGMNPTETNDLMRLIGKIRDAGVTVLLIEHHMKVVMGVSDRVIVLDHGRKIAEGTPAEVRSHPEVIAAYLGTG